MAKRRGADIVDVPAVVDEDQRVVGVEATGLVEWVRGLAAFFVRATELEKRATATLKAAQEWKSTPPKDARQDEELQRFIKRTTAERKELEEHWAITALVHRLHRRLTAKREIGVKALEEANTIGNRLHAQYVEDARRRAEAEERRKREEAEFLARQERQQELDRMEAEAVQAEEQSPELSKREAAFVEGYCRHENAQRAATEAGYPKALQAAARLMSSGKIQMAIKATLQATSIRRQAAERASAPVAIEDVTVKPEISRASGAVDRTTWAGVVLDERKLLTAFLGCDPDDYRNKFGIPADIWKLDPAALNRCARQLHERLNEWPGVQAKKTTSVV